MSDAPNIIIPPEHQSAPKVSPLLATAGAYGLRDGNVVREGEYLPEGASYNKGDEDMELRMAEDPRIAAELRDFSERVLSRSPQQTVEALLRKYEQNYAERQAQRWKGQKRWMGRENEEMRMVNILHCDSFIERLSKAGVNASSYDPFEWYRDNNIPVNEWPRPNLRCWLNSFVALIPVKSKITGEVRKISSDRVGISAWLEGEPKTVTTLQHPYSPEYSIMRFDEYDVPVDEKYRGWRTALIALVQCKVLTEAEVERAFGPAKTPAGEFYREQMYRLRAISLGVRKEEQ